MYLSRLRDLNADTGGVYTTSDLAVLLERSVPSRLTESINSLLRQGVLFRLRRGLYADRLFGSRPEIAGQRWIAPSYLSTESALHWHGLVDTGITAHTFVTRHPISHSRTSIKAWDRHHLIYRYLAPHVFFGYAPESGLLMALKEKAALDLLYFLHKGQRSVIVAEDIDFSRLDPRRYRRFLKAYQQPGFAGYALRWLPTSLHSASPAPRRGRGSTGRRP